MIDRWPRQTAALLAAVAAWFIPCRSVRRDVGSTHRLPCALGAQWATLLPWRAVSGRVPGGAFVAFHGSWNRAPLPQAGYNVVFVSFESDEPTGEWKVFADGFAGDEVGPGSADHRPCGVAEGPDGSLYVSDDAGGRIYRILYTGGRREGDIRR